ncbi:hypothetical protein HY212_03010 [Candidatus Pacearchaeota archaeon]|nr:hypothetical protein [Candidatus Pacearchaeota archaeon]
MNLQFLLSEDQKYDDCVPITLYGAMRDASFYLPPWFVAESCLDEIIDECVRFQLTTSVGSKIDDKGVYYILSHKRVKSARKIELSDPKTILQILDQLRVQGYQIPENYWKVPLNRERIKHLKSL